MFGFARIRKSQLTPQEYCQLKSYYCGLCHALRQDFNLLSSLLVGWDGRFLALLVEAQIPGLVLRSKTRCPATMGLLHNPIASYGVGTRYAAAVTVFLLGEKLDDNYEDDGSQLAKAVKRLTRKHFEQAAAILNEFNFPLELATSLRNEQATVESTARGATLSEVTAPSAKAVALIFAHTANLAGVEANVGPLTQIGRCVGRLVTLLDACHDYNSDIAKNKYNTIAATLPEQQSRQPVASDCYREVEYFLLEQLQHIRSQTKQLTLYRHERLVQNILMLGLYDTVIKGCQKFSQNVSDLETTVSAKLSSCPSCGAEISKVQRFCTACGVRLKGVEK
jgi:hypothetical protein